MAAPQTDPEDAKIVTLARAARARTSATRGAAVRDLDGRTYAASNVDLPHLRISAVALAVAMAVSSGAKGLEAAAVSTESDDVDAGDLDVLRDVAAAGTPVLVADRSGAVGRVSRT